MRRVTKKLLLFVLGVVFTGLYCEFLIYYVVIAQCSWPVLDGHHEQSQVLKAFILADTHLLGPRKGHWLDKWRREFQMQQAFQAVVTLHEPDVVFVLGDLFDEGEWSTEKQFNEYVERFYRLFAVPNNIKMFFVAGNHDIGFHFRFSEQLAQRFTKQLNSSSVQLITLKDNHFVLINSMAMHGDSCQLCTAARRRLDRVSEIFKCSESPADCNNNKLRKIKYSPPILMQHFPLFRPSDEACTEPDAPSPKEKKIPFRLKVDCLSKEATEYLAHKIRPRAVFGGHTHHGCLLQHKYKEIEFIEYSVPSFSWRNRVDPKYMLVSFTPDEYVVNKCGLPKESTMALTAVILLLITVLYTVKKRTLGRG